MSQRANTNMTVQHADSDAALRKASAVLLELRPAFNAETIVTQVRDQMKLGYRVAYVEEAGEVLCVAGFIVGQKLAWGKHIYVDDLVTSKHQRSRGAGATMINWLKEHARELGCSQLHLDSGVQRFGAHRFYLREGFNIESHHFSITNLPPA